MRLVDSLHVITVLNLCFCFLFSRFFWFLTKSIKNLEKTKKTKNNKIPDPNSPACAYMGLAILFFFGFFFWFSRGFLILLVKNQKTSRKPKKQKATKFQTLTHQLVPTWVLQFCFFFGFSRFFDTFGQKPKTSRKPKKNKKNKIADPNSPACAYMGLAIFVFLFFLVFSRFFDTFKPRRKLKNTRKKQNSRP